MTGTTITSNLTSGYYLTSTVANPVTVATGVTISDANGPGIGSQIATYWTIANYGTLQASGATAASEGILLAGGGGAVINMTSGSISGYYAGVSFSGSGTVVNQGEIATSNTVGSGFTYASGWTATTAGVLLGAAVFPTRLPAGSPAISKGSRLKGPVR